MFRSVGVSDAKEAISGDVQLARRFQEFDLPRWKADEKFQALVISILRNLPLDYHPFCRRARSGASCKCLTV